MPSAEAVVDLGAIRANVARLKHGTSAEVMAVVKADGYGHGLLPSATAALAGGATWLGVAQLDEALALRAGGIEAPVLAWLWTAGESAALAQAIAERVDIGVSSRAALAAVLATGDAGPGPPQDRHRVVAQRRPGRRVGRAGRRRGERTGRGSRPRRRSLESSRPRRRTR